MMQSSSSVGSARRPSRTLPSTHVSSRSSRSLKKTTQHNPCTTRLRTCFRIIHCCTKNLSNLPQHSLSKSRAQRRKIDHRRNSKSTLIYPQVTSISQSLTHFLDRYQNLSAPFWISYREFWS